MAKIQNNVLGACDYSLQELRHIRNKMTNLTGKQKEIAWSVGGIIAMITSKIINCSQEIMTRSLNAGSNDAKSDMRAIQAEFNAFIDRMIGENETNEQILN